MLVSGYYYTLNGGKNGMKRNRIILIAIILVLLIVMFIIVSNTLSNSRRFTVKVGIIDTNLSKDYASQNNRPSIMANMVNTNKENTHADMIVDTIKSRDSNCEIYLANVLNEKNTGDIDDVIKALEWLKEKEVDIICMSLTTFEDNEELRRTINELIKSDTLIVASCLNYSNAITFPACYDGVISVANCINEQASISITSKDIKDELKATKWKECSTSILTAYITGEISKDISEGRFNLDKFILKYNMH